MKRLLVLAGCALVAVALALFGQAPLGTSSVVPIIPTPVSIANGGTGTGSTLTGIVRGSSSAMTAAELSGDCATSGSNAATCTALHLLTAYNGLALVANGIPILVAKADVTAQAADLSATTLYAVAASGVGGPGLYRFSCYFVITQAATNSSLLPNCRVTWTDSETSTVESAIPVSDNASGNTVGTVTSGAGSRAGMLLINAKASTNIQYVTNNYASSGVTPMQFSAHFKLEYLGQ